MFIVLAEFLLFHLFRCPSNYTGRNCKQDVDECSVSNPCQNGASCHNRVGGYWCSCFAGWTGTHCEVNIDDCASNPCRFNGTCVDGIGKHTCKCTQGRTGQFLTIIKDLGGLFWYMLQPKFLLSKVGSCVSQWSILFVL